MKTTTKPSKRIFSLFLAVLCTLGVFFVSYIDSFADASYYVSASGLSSTTGSNVRNSGIDFGSLISNGSTVHYYALPRLLDSCACYLVVSGGRRPCMWFVDRSSPSSAYSNTFWASTTSGSSVYNGNWERYGSTNLFYNFFSVVLTSNYNVNLPVFNSYSEMALYYRDNLLNPPTPTPTPTPTPAPATPTPNPYGPGPVPTIPPGDQSYTDFFTRLASDAQSAFNAIFLSWTSANGRFYSGIFFIGFPVLLGLIGLVASIFFGDDD